MISGRWIMRGIGFVSTLILVRLLAPEDFGLLAMCSVIIGLTDILFEFGLDTAIIQNEKLTDSYVHTAWTIRLLQSILVAGVLIAIAPLAGAYYHDDRVASLLPLLALAMVIRGFSSIGLVLLRRELQFRTEVAYGVAVRLATFFLNVGLAWYFRNYWALVVATICSGVIGCVGSYWVHPYRPRASLEKFGEIWSFSQWMLLAHISNYACNQVDQLIIGAKLGAQNAGVYAVSTEIAELPTTELIFPISRVLFPGFAKLRAEPERLKHAFLNALGFLATFSVPAGIGVALLAERLVPLLLGEKWNDAIPVIQILAVFSVFRTLFGLPSSLLLVFGRVRLLTVFTVVQLLLFLGGTWALIGYGLTGVAIAKAAAAALFLLLVVDRLPVLFPITRREILSQLVRPTIATTAMATTLLSAAQYLPDQNLLALMVQVLLGALSYSLALLTLWLIAGRPQGTETFLLGHVQRLAHARNTS